MKKILLTTLLLLNMAYAKDIYATFSVEPLQDAKLAFISSGIVQIINIDVGSSVKKGAVLAELENSDIEAMLEVAKSSYKYAKKDYERQVKIKELIDEGKFDSAAAKYEGAKNQLSYQKALYNKTFLRAPFDGVIYNRELEVGDAVSGMMLKTVFKIQSATKRKLVLEFDQKNYEDVKVGNKFTYKVDGNVNRFKGKISKVYPHANKLNRKVKAEVKASNLLPGLFGDGYITVSDK